MSKKKFKHGFSALDYPRNVRWAFDYDYLDSLDPDELRWLQEFTERDLGASFPPGDDFFSQAQRRDSYVKKNRANRDTYGIVESGGRLDAAQALAEVLDAASFDPEVALPSDPIPAYLSSAPYKAALADLRAAIDVAESFPSGSLEKSAATQRVADLRARLERLTRLAD